MPKRLVIVGVAFCLLGAWATVRMALGLASGVGDIELDFVALPVGIGLLLGRPAARTWALALVLLGIGVVSVVSLLAGVATLAGPTHVSASILGLKADGTAAVLVLIVQWLVAVALLAVAWQLLNAELVCVYFQKRRRVPPAGVRN